MKKEYMKPQMEVVNMKAGARLLTGSDYQMRYIQTSGSKPGADLDLRFGGGGHEEGRSRGFDDDWDWDEEW